MRRQDRHPFKWGTGAWRNEYARLRAKGMHPKTARSVIRCTNWEAEQMPLRGERCGAMTRKGTPCQAPAIKWRSHGKCRMHGSSEGPTTEAGKLRALANLKQYRR